MLPDVKPQGTHLSLIVVYFHCDDGTGVYRYSYAAGSDETAWHYRMNGSPEWVPVVAE